MTNQATHRESVAQAVRAHDPQRPQYHFLPPSGWMNDPNGLIQWQGTYHLFYQYNPAGAVHRAIHWGHAVSADLVHWADRPLALAPTPGGPDADGCFSGCAVDDGGVPTILYTGVRGPAQRPCLAVGSPDLRTWVKDPANPVIPEPPPDLDLVAFRDHTVWREDGLWYQAIGSGIRGRGGAALLYRSPDLRRWEYRGPLAVGAAANRTPPWTGTMWECPDFFVLDDRHVLVVSVWDDGDLYYPIAMVGAYAGERFTPATTRRLDFGRSFYAPQSMRDAAGRRLMWGWLREGWDAAAQRAAGWSGVMSLPRVLTLGPGDTVETRPAPELAALRGAAHAWRDLAVDGVIPLDGAQGDTLEILAEIDPGDAAEIGLLLRAAPDGAEQTRLVYDVRAGEIVLDTTQASRRPDVAGHVDRGALALAPGEPLRLHVFLDRSVIEVFANDRLAGAARIYPYRPDSLGVALLARGGTAHARTLDVWALELDLAGTGRAGLKAPRPRARHIGGAGARSGAGAIGQDCSGGGAGSGGASCPALASRNSRIPVPRVFPRSASLPGPKMINTIARMTIRWVGWSKPSNMNHASPAPLGTRGSRRIPGGRYCYRLRSVIPYTAGRNRADCPAYQAPSSNRVSAAAAPVNRKSQSSGLRRQTAQPVASRSATAVNASTLSAPMSSTRQTAVPTST